MRFLIVFVCLIHHSLLTAQKDTLFYPDGKIKAVGKTVNDKREGLWNFYLDDGRLSLSGKYKNGERTGKWMECCPADTAYYLNDQSEYFRKVCAQVVCADYSHRNLGSADTILYWFDLCSSNKVGNMYGTVTTSPVSGMIFGKGTYLHNKKDGAWTYYDQHGQKILEVLYSDGMVNGNIKEYARLESGKYYCSFSVSAINDTLDGLCKIWTEDGYVEENYKRGVLDGNLQMWTYDDLSAAKLSDPNSDQLIVHRVATYMTQYSDGKLNGKTEEVGWNLDSTARINGMSRHFVCNYRFDTLEGIYTDTIIEDYPYPIKKVYNYQYKNGFLTGQGFYSENDSLIYESEGRDSVVRVTYFNKHLVEDSIVTTYGGIENGTPIRTKRFTDGRLNHETYLTCALKNDTNYFPLDSSSYLYYLAGYYWKYYEPLITIDDYYGRNGLIKEKTFSELKFFPGGCTSGVDVSEVVREIDYDDSGMIIKDQQSNIDGWWPRPVKTIFYSPPGHYSGEIIYEYSNSLTTEHEYNSAGKLIRITIFDADGKIINEVRK